MNAIETKHTAGPWRAVGGDELVFVARPNIAHVGVTGGRANDAPFVVVGNPGPKGSEEADARLIAAAPDMLVALKAQEEADEANEARLGYAEWQVLEDKAKALRVAAIAKAEGRSS